ncbi:MAG TPA: amidohydrolase family protein [Candidatus Sulfotelmatobacter sp.]|nr:amidohydrolase family protein [Candidatus Sulfotelmatobacter sp.]
MAQGFSRRDFLKATATGATTLSSLPSSPLLGRLIPQTSPDSNRSGRILDCHVHFDDKNPNFVEELIKLCTRLNMTACVLTPYANRKITAQAAQRYPIEIVPMGFVDLDAADATQQVKDFHELGYRGLGELEFVKNPFTDPGYFPVYELANEYGWTVLFHTGIVLRKKFDEPENVASYRMRAFHLEEIARRYPKLTVIGAHCGNPEYDWAAEVARWNPNVFFDLSGSTLTKMKDRLTDFRQIFWWSGSEKGTKTPNNDSSAFSKLVFGSDTSLDSIEGVISQYRGLFQACGVPESTQQLIMGGTLSKVFGLTR